MWDQNQKRSARDEIVMSVAGCPTAADDFEGVISSTPIFAPVRARAEMRAPVQPEPARIRC